MSLTNTHKDFPTTHHDLVCHTPTAYGLYEYGSDQYIMNIINSNEIQSLLADIEAQYSIADADSIFAWNHGLTEEYDEIRKSIIKLAKFKQEIIKFMS